MQPKIYPQEEHGILIEQVDRDALYVLEKLRTAGYIAYLVGGSVRDLLLGEHPKDYDISTSAKPEEIKALFRNCILIGRRFRLAHIRFGRKILEVSTFRSGDVDSEDLILRDNQWGTAEEDVTRRDFTINGLFFDSFEQTVIDYVGGYPDITKKYLRTIGQPYLRFKQDPVRMIRLLKFQARFSLDVDPDTRQALLECRSEIIKSAPARVLEELLRMLESGASYHFIKLMTDHGMLQPLLPDISRFLESNDGENVFSYLQEIDLHHKEPPREKIDRAVLLSSLAFPLLQTHIHAHIKESDRKPHLGEIQDETYEIISKIFGSFFHIPKRLKGKMISLLTSQYRITPIDPRPGRRVRIPKIADFSLAIDFLKLRARLEPGLDSICEEWCSAFTLWLETNKPEPRARKKRPRRRRKTHDPS